MIWLWIPGLALLAYVAWFVRLWRFVNLPTTGPRIDPNRRGIALLVIDAQREHLEPDHGDFPDLLTPLQDAITNARRRGWLVIALRHGWQTPGTRLMARMMLKGKGQAWEPLTEIHPALSDRVDHVVTKRVQDGFETPELDALLARLGVGHVVLAGLDGHYCVRKTALGALNRGYDVSLAEAAIQSVMPDRWQAWVSGQRHRLRPCPLDNDTLDLDPS